MVKIVKSLFSNFFLYKINAEHGTGLGSVVPSDSGVILGRSTKSYISHEFYPKNVNWDLRNTLTNQLSDTNYKQKDFAIIIAGPLIYKNKFTLNTIKHYRKFFPYSNIFLSTWDNENKNYLQECANLCDQIFLSKMPESSGWGNLNLQKTTTLKPLQFALNKGIKFTIKSRTDCIVYDHRLLINLVNKREIIEKISKEKNEKIFISDLGTYKFRPYGPTDIFQFSKTNTLFDYWNVGSEKELIKKLQNKYHFENRIKNHIPIVAEILLCLNYLDSLKCDIKFDLKDWYKYFVKYFSVISSSDIKLLWFKYDWRTKGHKAQSFHNRGAVFLDENDYLNLLLRGDASLLNCNISEKWRVATTDKNYPKQEGIEQISY